MGSKRQIRLVVCILLAGMQVACEPPDYTPRSEPLWPDIDLSLYKNLPKLDEPGTEGRDWSKITPAQPTDYWAMRGKIKYRDFPTLTYRPNGILASAGEKCKTASNREKCVAEFDALSLSEESPSCGEFGRVVGYQNFIVSNRGETNRLWEMRNVSDFRGDGFSVSAVSDFLGTIDSEEEATLLAYSNCFYSGSNTRKEYGAIRAFESGYELIVLDRPDLPPHSSVEMRLLLRIDSVGKVTVLRSHRPQ